VKRRPSTAGFKEAEVGASPAQSDPEKHLASDVVYATQEVIQVVPDHEVAAGESVCSTCCKRGHKVGRAGGRKMAFVPNIDGADGVQRRPYSELAR
jgi:hypothetical protein